MDEKGQTISNNYSVIYFLILALLYINILDECICDKTTWILDSCVYVYIIFKLTLFLISYIDIQNPEFK